VVSSTSLSDQAAERDAGEGDNDEEMGQAKTAEDLQREAADKETAFKAKKKARLEKPSSANDKGSFHPASSDEDKHSFADGFVDWARLLGR